ncbi:Putative U4/U6 small nuclear ribonucleoprotein Prp3 [Septoria linicola]|uniref:U4/U6 small nuclear ribonucleoprotein Prp3 n=1 Tax=Septoria linicola TaxID=215465 RepID=A0A9Q9EN60_9PEZI|nr:putative U4/U6 small nuclear ribonucleoprotein Prp3 [Septoria linicola]USW56267.1 Putative U4/U6 small nuclear ribonucleoprotein Prp3 [Septoria linicola]
MTGKRPYESNGEGSDVKRQRAGDGSPLPVRQHEGGESELERKKRETAEKMAALKARIAANKPNGGASALPAAAPATPVDDQAAKKAEVAAKIAAMKAKMAAKKPTPVNGFAAAPPPQEEQAETPSWLLDARKRAQDIAAAARKPAQPAVPAPPPRVDGKGATGGLGIGLHPSLLGDAGGDRGRAGQSGPKFSTTKGNRQPEKPKINPYLDAQPDETQTVDDSIYAPTARKYAERKSRQIQFSEKGKYMAQAAALRQQAQLEEMKRRLAAEARKTEIEEASDKAFLVPEPPEVEWWDEGLLPEGQSSYENWEQEGRNKIAVEDSIITALIQRPVLLAAPQDKFAPAPKPLMLTTKEQKKLRRQRRMADMKEEQAKIRLGLIEPPPPKVKKSNMMRVLGEQAVKDPTAVEARVNREIAQRANDHEVANEERKLTPQQRAEKLKQQQAGDEAKGVKIAVFRVDDLSSGKHRYQLDVNAKQNGLTGMVILNPSLNLVIVEGGAHSIKAYKKLVLNRIKWTENTAPPPDSTPTTFTGTTDGSNANVTTGTRGQGSKAAEWCNPLDEHGDLKDLSANVCELIWEGEEATRSFKRWGSRACETDGEAKDVLTKTKMENMWTLARSKQGQKTSW